MKALQFVKLAFLMAAAGCTQADKLPISEVALTSASYEPTEVSLATITSNPAIPTSTPSPSVTPRIRPTLTGTLEPFPVPPSQLLLESPYFADTSICELPCWNGLIVGVSRLEDAQAVMQTVFGLSESQALWASQIQRGEIPELYFVEYIWNTPEGLGRLDSFNGLLSIWFWIEYGTDTIKAIGIRWVPDDVGIQVERSLADVLLASHTPPAEILLRIQPTERADLLAADVSVIHENGYGARYHYIMHVVQSDEHGIAEVAELCLGDMFEGNLYVMEPFWEEIGNLDPIQQYLTSGMFDGTTPIEQLSDLNLEEIYQLARSQPSACIPLTLKD